jgi:hypothetical protein
MVFFFFHISVNCEIVCGSEHEKGFGKERASERGRELNETMESVAREVRFRMLVVPLKRVRCVIYLLSNLVF